MKPHRFPSFARVTSLFACVTALTPGFTSAALFYWDGSAADNSWANALNWSTALTPDTGSGVPNGDSVFFNATGVAGPVTVNLDGNQAASGLTTNSANGFLTTIQGGVSAGNDYTLQLGSGGITHAIGGLTIGSATLGKVTVSLQGSQTWSSSAGAPDARAIFVLNDVSLGVSGAHTLTLAGNNNGSKIDGIISDGTAGGTLALQKTGGASSIWTLNGANTYSGGTTLTAGGLNINHATALGTGNFTITTGTINNTSGAAVTLANNNTQTWNGSFTFTGANVLNLGTGAVSLGTAAGTARTITVNGSTLTVGGVISNGTTANALIKAGTGALTLSGGNLYTGGTTLGAGTLNLNHATALGTGNFIITAGTINNTSGADITLTTNNTQTWDGNFTFTGTNSLNLGTGAVSLGTAAGTARTITVSANTLTVGGAISDGTTATGLIKTGAGTLVLSGASTYTGPTVISNGILSVASLNSVAGGAASSNLGTPITVSDGTINLGATTTAGQLLYTGGGETTDRVLNLAGTTGGAIITHNGTGLLKFTSNLTATGNGSKTLTLQGTGDGEIAGIIANSTSNTGLAKSGAGTWTLSAANTYTGTTTVNEGTLRLAGAGLLSTGHLAMNGGQLDLNGTSQTVTNFNGAAAATILNNAATTTSTLTIGNVNGTGTYAGALADGSGILALTKTGSGNITLSGANSYTGLTTVAGTAALIVGHNNALGSTDGGTVVNDGARLSLADGVTVTGEALTITGQGGGNGALQVGSNVTGTWNGSITTTGTEARLGTQSGGHLIINGNIDASARGIIIRTVGDASTAAATFDSTLITLGGTYTGADLILYQGVVKLGASERISDSTLITLGTTASTNIKQRFDLNGFNETVAGITVAGTAASATHEVTNSSATSSTLTLNSSGDNLLFSGIVTGNLAIDKMGSNTMTFSGANTYTGTTTVRAGTLAVSHAGGLGSTDGETVVNTGAALALSGGITITGETLTLNGTGVSSGGALRNTSGNNTWAGTVILGAGADPSSGSAARIRSDSGRLTISGVIQDGTTGNVGIRNTGSGTVAFSGENTYTGTTHIVVGALSVGSINSVSTNPTLGTVHSASSNLGAPTTIANGTIHLTTTAEAGELIYTGGGETTDRVINLAGTTANGGAILTQNGTGPLKFTSDLTATGESSKTLTLRGTGEGELAGAIVNNSATNITSISKSGAGTWVLSGVNTYTGGTSVNGGTLVVSGGINSSTSLSVDNGTFRLGANDVVADAATVTLGVGGILETNDFSDLLGALAIAGDSTINLTGTSVLQFADSSGSAWSGLLSISGWSGLEEGSGAERLIFGSSASGLTPDQLSRISFLNPEGFDPGSYGAAILGNGEVVPLIPEPSTALLAVAGACGFALRRRRTA